MNILMHVYVVLMMNAYMSSHVILLRVGTNCIKLFDEFVIHCDKQN
jgi:hypothetical protein